MGISTHILDTSCGRPAAGVSVLLSRMEYDTWITLAEGKTDADGRCRQLLPERAPLDAGLYRIRFETAAYYHAQQQAGLYPYVEIAFTVGTWTDDEIPHYHIPLLLTGNGYTTYRGS